MFINKKNIKLKKQNGAVSTIVLFTVLMFIIILSSIYMIISSAQKSQLKSDLRIQDVYEKEINDVSELYTQTNTEIGPSYIPNGFTHTEGSIDTGYVIKDYATGNEFVWVPCVLSKASEDDDSVVYERVLPETKDATDKNYLYNANNLTITGEEGTDAEEVRESVQKYGGFYIARYEAGIGNTTSSSTTNEEMKKDLTRKPVSKKGVGVWNFITRANAIIVSKNMISEEETGAKSTLITGEAWDTTLKWLTLVDSSYYKYALNKGNYTGTIRETGYYKKNNIYDMAGNIEEWTTENATVGTTKYVVARGGRYNNKSVNWPTAYRDNLSTTTSNALAGFRVIMYKK